MIHPCQDELAGNAGHILQFFTALRGLAFLQQLVNSNDTGGD